MRATYSTKREDQATAGKAQAPVTGVYSDWSATAGRTARFRVGPEFALDSAGTGRQTAFQTLIGLAYNAR